MARKAALKGLEAKIGGVPALNTRGLIPKWLLYSGIGTALLGAVAAAYIGIRSLGVTLPPQSRPAGQGQEQQYTPPQNSSKAEQQIAGIENVMSREQLKTALEELLVTDRPITAEDAEILRKAERVNKSIYFMLTGKTFEQQKFVTKILPQEEYDAVVHPNLKGSGGTIGWREDGNIYIYNSLPVASSRSLLLGLATETGQAYFAREGPRNIDVGITKPDQALGELRGEFLTAIYRAAVVNRIREEGVKDVALSPQTLNDIGASVDRILSPEYSRGEPTIEAWGAAWVLTLDDPEAKANLEATGWAGSEPLMRMFAHYALLDFKQNLKEKNIRREAEFKQKLKTALQNGLTYAPLIKTTLGKRIDPKGKENFVYVLGTLP